MSDPLTIRAWLKANRPAPRSLERVLAERLIGYHDAQAMFDAFNVRGLAEAHVLSAACAAVTYAGRELRRPPRKEEREALATVQRAIAGLRKAIEASPLPGEFSTFYELSAKGWPTVPLMIGWRDLRGNIHEAFGYPLTVYEVLDIADALLARHREGLPRRVVERQRARPRENALVRSLAHVLFERFNVQPLDGIACVVNAILELNGDDEIGPREVGKMLPARLKGKKASP